MGTPTHYDMLGVAATASAAEIQTAYRAAARRLHPDAGGNAVAMRQLNEAWYVLRDPGRRSAYDRTLAPGRPAGTARSADVMDTEASSGRRPDDEMVDTEMAETVEFGDDLLDTVPVGEIRSLEGWLALLPPAALMLAIGLFVGGLVFASPALLVFSGGAGLVALGLFILAPLVAMSRPARRDRSGP